MSVMRRGNSGVLRDFLCLKPRGAEPAKLLGGTHSSLLNNGLAVLSREKFQNHELLEAEESSDYIWSSFHVFLMGEMALLCYRILSQD